MADSFERLKKVMDNKSSMVIVEPPSRPSNVYYTEPDKHEILLELDVSVFNSLSDADTKLVRDTVKDGPAFLVPPSPNDKLVEAVDYDPDTGALTITRENGEELVVEGLETIYSLGKGPKGKRGLKGHKGKDAHKGKDGAKGYTGPVGEAGPVGGTGITGSDGKNGATGRTGPEGDPGPAGQEGPGGKAGPLGHVGERGLNGCKGPTGFSGEKGPAPVTNVFISTVPPDNPAVYIWGVPV